MYFNIFFRKMKTIGQEIARRVPGQLGYCFYGAETIENVGRGMGFLKDVKETDEKVPSLSERLFSHQPEVHLHHLRSVILLFCFFITIIFPSIGFGNGAFYYTANEGGSISKVDASSNTLIKSIKLEGVVHNAQISPNGEILGAVLIPKMASHEKEHEMAGLALFSSIRKLISK